MFREPVNGLPDYLNAVAKIFDRKCPDCGSPLELVSLSKIGIKNLRHNGLVECTNEDCEFKTFAMIDEEEEEEWRRTGRMPGWATENCKVISFDELK